MLSIQTTATVLALVLGSLGAATGAAALAQRPAPAPAPVAAPARASVQSSTAALARALDARFGAGTAAGLRIVAVEETDSEDPLPVEPRARALREAALRVAARLDVLAADVTAGRVDSPERARDRYRQAFVDMGRELDAR